MCYGNQTWSEESLMWVYNDDDLHGGQRSSEVKCGKLCAMATKLGQKNPWCKFMMMMTFMKVITIINLHQGFFLTKFGNQSATFTTFNDDDLHGGQRSSEVKCGNYVIWLPNLVRRNPGASLWWWWWPSWRSKVIRG